MGFGEGSVYADFTPTWRGREAVSDRPSAQEKVARKKKEEEEDKTIRKRGRKNNIK